MIPTTDGAAVPRTPAVVPAVPSAVDPDALAERWVRLEAKALDVVEPGVDGAFEDPDPFRAQLAAADRVLGFRRGGLPMPAIGGMLREATVIQHSRGIRIRWTDGRTVRNPHRRDTAAIQNRDQDVDEGHTPHSG
jgi:hypothetical protein